MSSYLSSFLGGLMLGLSAALLLLVNGRIAGISGILGGILGGRNVQTNIAFVAGLIAGPLVYKMASGHLPAMTISTAWPLVALSGLFVGIGTRMGSGCTSGHGILGLARFSKRSLAATATFLLTGIVTATGIGMLR